MRQKKEIPVRQALAITEVMELLQVSRPSVYKLIHTNKLATYRIGSRRFVTVRALEDCIKRLEQEASISTFKKAEVAVDGAKSQGGVH